MDTVDNAFIASLLAERELSPAEMVHAEQVGKLQKDLRILENLSADPTLSAANRIAVSKQMTRVTNAIHKHMHELRQGVKRVEREEARDPAARPPGVRDGAGPSPESRALLHQAVASSRARTARLRAQQRPSREV
jgi:hypothetical protein